MELKRIVEGTDTWAGRAFNGTVQVLILASLAAFCAETLPGLSARAQFWLYVAEVVTVSLFTIEYGLRILASDRPLRFIFSFYGLVDLAAILPFYLALGVDLRTVRVLRLFRIFRVFKLLRYTEAIERFREALIGIKEELVVFAVATVMIVFLSSVGIWHFEHEAQPEKFASVFHCMWWSIVTLTTVGYGDVYPVTVGGKIFTSGLLLVGLGIVAVPTGLLAAALTKTRKPERPNHARSDG
jgi:voltage-gated potassium channel